VPLSVMMNVFLLFAFIRARLMCVSYICVSLCVVAFCVMCFLCLNPEFIFFLARYLKVF